MGNFKFFIEIIAQDFETNSGISFINDHFEISFKKSNFFRKKFCVLPKFFGCKERRYNMIEYPFKIYFNNSDIFKHLILKIKDCVGEQKYLQEIRKLFTSDDLIIPYFPKDFEINMLKNINITQLFIYNKFLLEKLYNNYLIKLKLIISEINELDFDISHKIRLGFIISKLNSNRINFGDLILAYATIVEPPNIYYNIDIDKTNQNIFKFNKILKKIGNDHATIHNLGPISSFEYRDDIFKYLIKEDEKEVKNKFIDYSEIKEKNYETSCGICFDDFEEGDIIIKSKICNGIFHKECIDEWININPSCPICRAKFEDDGILKFGKIYHHLKYFE